MKIINVPKDEKILKQLAEILMESFRHTGSKSWTTLELANQEIVDSLTENRISRVAIDEKGNALGWIGGIEEYDGFVWELHPLVVREDIRKQGIGRMLVDDFAEQVKLRGGKTIFLGTDDETNQTSIGGVDLYPNVLENLLNIKNLHGHPFEFYQKLGFVITGVIPDANGFGKPDILMCKRV